MVYFETPLSQNIIGMTSKSIVTTDTTVQFLTTRNISMSILQHYVPYLISLKQLGYGNISIINRFTKLFDPNVMRNVNTIMIHLNFKVWYVRSMFIIDFSVYKNCNCRNHLIFAMLVAYCQETK